MNPLLNYLRPYPFEKLQNLLGQTSGNPNFSEINLTIGEPMHAIPAFVKTVLEQHYLQLAKYPKTSGMSRFKQACSEWLHKRYGVLVNPESEILSANGTKEALFAFIQAALNTDHQEAYVVVPNPAYQIYEGATILAGGQIAYVNTYAPEYMPQWDEIASSLWNKIQVVIVCSPGNPTGSVLKLNNWKVLFQLQEKYGFLIVSDECYSELYLNEKPIGILAASQKLGYDFSKKLMLTSLSKRSNLPGLRSGFVAGDADLIKNFLKYRTYHGSAMSELVQEISIAAWQDEKHVAENRECYQRKFSEVISILQNKYSVSLPEASFYLWLEVGDDLQFAFELFQKLSVKVLPGSFLAHDTSFGNPGKGMIRIALVPSLPECREAAKRMLQL